MTKGHSSKLGCLIFAGLFFGSVFSGIVLWWLYTGEIHTRMALTTWKGNPVKFVIMTGIMIVFALVSLAMAIAGLKALSRRK